MPLVLTEGPAVEPVSLAELKAQTRVDGSDEDTLLSSLIVAARIHVEQTFGLALINQDWSYFFDKWPDRPEIRAPLTPIRQVSALRVYDCYGVAANLNADDYIADVSPRSIRIARRAGATWPTPGRQTNGVEIGFSAGFGAEGREVPEPIRRAILLLAAWWFDEREPTAAEQLSYTPPAILALLGPYREFRL